MASQGGQHMSACENTHGEAVQCLALKGLASRYIKFLKFAVEIFGRHARESDCKNTLWISASFQQPRNPALHRKRLTGAGSRYYPNSCLVRSGNLVGNAFRIEVCVPCQVAISHLFW